MNITRARRMGAAAFALAGLGLLAVVSLPHPAEGQTTVQDGKAGYVVADISFALTDATEERAICPNGPALGAREIFAQTPDGQRRDGETDQAYGVRVRAAVQTLSNAPNGANLCANPEAGSPDPHHRTVTGQVASFGIDLDGQVSRANGRAAPGTCAHDDFRGMNGERGVDNQFLRAVGCTDTFLPGGQANTFATEMLTGSWGILIALEGVDDLRNDNDVTVNFYANSDPIELSPNREPLTNATYAAQQDPRYRATTRGRIVNGVLTSDPVDTRFHWVVNNIRLDRPLRDTRLRMTVNADGSMDGIMAGYAPVEEMYDTIFGFRSGKDAQGNPAPERLRNGSSNGYAFTAQHTCNGVYYAMRQMADGHPDAAGSCTSISTQYRIRLIPAFVVDAQTRSANQDLAN